MTLMRAECSMIPACDCRYRGTAPLRWRSERGLRPGLGALWMSWRQGGSFGAEPSACCSLRLGAIRRTEIGKGLVEHRVSLAGGFGHEVPFQRLDLVGRRALSVHQHPGEA